MGCRAGRQGAHPSGASGQALTSPPRISLNPAPSARPVPKKGILSPSDPPGPPVHDLRFGDGPGCPVPESQVPQRSGDGSARAPREPRLAVASVRAG